MQIFLNVWMHERFVDVDGHRIRYLDGGDPEHGTLLMLHGLGGSAERWSDVMPTFSKYYRVVAPDLLGFGFSDKPQINYTPESLSFFVDSFIRTVCNQRIFLMGSSLGGQIATLYAASHPASIGKLVLVAPSGTTYKTTPAFNTYVTAAMYPSEQTAARAFEEMDASGEPVADETINSFVKRMKTKNAKMAFMSAVLGLKNDHITESTLEMIGQHTLIVWGSEDPVIPIRYGGYFVTSIRNSEFFRMDGCGHAPYAQEPQKFTERVLRFLSS